MIIYTILDINALYNDITLMVMSSIVSAGHFLPAMY